ncbi:leucine-rich repeat-containing protein 9 isoform X1 [Coregonus clupeaformis]|uniref:leucine-rich repeat-containing protein 9 isoform X1 n=1 Tax=Coregonus clupeaformis TaxID=59861 RepID=UPI001BE075BA|nr:leucine-rich repeat-containing protein 9 isoform X1 [Coregonus clupeaformis]XP_041710982.1 leucine-rich repeat-containing protein 9 isoform X1 [Coregonus clupeaformis]XP_041710983.1 leucine-rich repeat-containing protein 9 isoform X1 [Coregonus clupeaformis]
MIQSEKQRHNGDEEVVKELCIANGVSYEKIPQEGSSITALEVFFSGYPRMVGLSLFPRLCQLTLVGQSISHIKGLESCPLLRELWVVECQLTDISGLQNCHQLQKLYIYDNQISKIENLESLVNLQVLWLNNNFITHIEGLNTLQKLRELNLADNNIEKIGHSLDPNISIENLNLSGNKISSFKELTLLAPLPSLRELGLKDPQSSPTPVCLLCNYATHVLYHMPGLQRLDTYDVSSKHLKDAAESTVMKKMMYYNMRVRTAQRNLAETQANLLENKRNLLQLPEDRIRALNYALKNLECELSEVQALCRKSARTWEDGLSPLSEGSGDRSDTPADITRDPGLEHKILSKLDTLKERLQLWNRRLEEIESWYQRDLAQATNRNEMMVHFLLMELETVGNIRFEEGCSTDPWFTSCYDLLLSRFCAWDYKAQGITGIKINSIIRIHNRALRLRFEDKLHTLLASEESTMFSQNYKRWLEYLFYVSDPERTSDKNEMLHIPEDGFKTADMYKALGRERAVPLSNSLSVTDRPRIEYTQRQANQSTSKQSIDPLLFRHALYGQVIVSKVFLGRSFPIREGDSVDALNYPKAHSVYCNVSPEQVHKTNAERPCSSKIHSGCDCSLRQSQWFVFDHELVLPEYLIDFEYITQDRVQPVFPEPSSRGTDDPTPNDINLDKETLNMEPLLKPRPKMLSLDEKTLLNVARANVLSQITVLNLHGNSLSKLKEISRLTALRRLTISFNEFTQLDDISHMPNLEFVDASYNHLLTLEGLRGLGRLNQLDLRWNQLTRAREETAVLRKHAPNLLRLDTRHNPWHRPEAVRMTVLGRLINLTHLDDMLVTEEEAGAAVQMAAGSRINQASLLAHSRTDSERPRSLSLLSAAQLLDQLSPLPWDITGDLEPGWTTKITALNLDSQRLSRLTNLDKLVNLRWASFNDNDISKVEGLDNCQHLEELSLNDNCISRLDGVSKLHQLTKLSVNGNQLSCLDGTVLDRLPNLHFLSVENNCIGSLYGVHRARSLFELYIGNNIITTTRDIYHLKALTNLIILDLYGNPLVEKVENYRIYVVFHLPSLKALDGVAVEMTECENAKDVFGGRLTPDMVAEKLGHSNYSDIVDLNLQSSAISMVDLAPADLFQNMRSVNLEHNNLTSFSGLVYLPNIKALCLNYNHIESILPRQKAQAPLTNRQILYHKVNSSGYGQQGSSKGSREVGPADSLEPLMGSLEVLHLSHNGISNMANLQLSRLTNLKALFLQGNEISQVEGLEGLHRLRELVLDRNRIKALGENSFFGQVFLLELHLAENRLRELNHLQPLTELRRLFLGMNKLQDISELDKLEVLPSLIELSVVGNPVARRSLHRPAVVLRLSRLQVLDGVMVTLEERTRAELLCTEVQCPMAPGSGMDMNLPGLLPLMSRTAPLRGTSLSGGLQLQHFLGHEILMPCNLDEALPHDTPKHKKQKHSSAANHVRSAQVEMTFRQIRGTASTLPSTGLLPNGYRVLITNPNQEQDSRYQSGGAPKPPPM